MPATYSINVGTQLEAYRKTDIISVLKDIPDNVLAHGNPINKIRARITGEKFLK